ncbi:ADP-ribosylation factor-binding protein GGA3-like [Pungitius pungitius]|uniref:ADP-ribosylation factor-binding protein GGA3-like n=1 Tax=Pungitius pungitius TaxID=134920 RepID=UPI002E1645B8
MATAEATLQSWLNQATDPNNQEDRWDCIQGFYQLVDREPDGPQAAIRLLAHKIQSPQQREALQALTVLEACMNNCGKRFHGEAAKFRFLNELLKLLTPKYFGAWTPQKVKDRVTEVLYGWTLWLKDEPKIQEAYNMLKKQGLVTKDPKLPDAVIMAPPTQRTADSVFDREDKAALLARLLKSARPEDLEAANRLIKSTIREEQEKAEKVSKRESTLEEVESSTKRLRELLDRHAASGAPFHPGDEAKALYERCDGLRPSLFRLASDTMEDDEALAQILSANDELTLVVSSYKERVGRGGCDRRTSAEETEGEGLAPKSPTEIKSYHLIDLSALDSPQTHRKADSPASSGSPSPPLSSLLESTFRSAGEPDRNEAGLDHLAYKRTPETASSYYEELLQFNGAIQMQHAEQNRGGGVVLRARGCGAASSNGTSLCRQFTADPGSPPKSHKPLGERSEESSLTPDLLKNIVVPIETIKSGNFEPITVYDHGGVHVSLHFARDPPPGRPRVAVVVLSAVNTSALQVKDFLFQAAVPKTMSVKLQPASGTDLAAYNPLLPPPAVSQVLLLSNPRNRRLRLRYKLTLTHGGRQLIESGDVDNFPDWTSLVGPPDDGSD